MTYEQEQIKVSYEGLQMTPEEIANDRNLDVVAVKASLYTVSSLFRKNAENEQQALAVVNSTINPKTGFTGEEVERVRRRILDIAIGSDNEGVALKAAIYINDESHGRHDVVSAVRGLNFNVLDFNSMLRAADDAVNRALGKSINV